MVLGGADFFRDLPLTSHSQVYPGGRLASGVQLSPATTSETLVCFALSFWSLPSGTPEAPGPVGCVWRLEAVTVGKSWWGPQPSPAQAVEACSPLLATPPSPGCTPVGLMAGRKDCSPGLLGGGKDAEMRGKIRLDVPHWGWAWILAPIPGTVCSGVGMGSGHGSGWQPRPQWGPGKETENWKNTLTKNTNRAHLLPNIPGKRLGPVSTYEISIKLLLIRALCCQSHLIPLDIPGRA